ncbi:MAG TPA: flagellar hook-associated protein FlgL [Terriglobales bacterium]|jgi:flagellar hook-associated protein 3 FlgL|nr:flagellar hook-associated protein FlgL [Terriglobales bacterium]
MRVNPNFSADILQDLYQSQNQEQTTIEQMSSGELINMPSDNPAGASALVENQAVQSQTDQFLQNTSNAEGLLQTADSTLSSVVSAVNRAISLGVQGGTDTISDADRQSIAQEVQGIQSQIVQLANVSYQGNYVFAGTATNAPPFTLNSGAPDGVTYNGNDNTNTVEIADGRSIQLNLPGDQVFQGAGGDVFGALQQLVTALQNNDTNGVSAATTQLGGALGYLSQQRVFYGNAVNQLTSNQGFLQQEQVNLQSQENSIDAVNIPAAATNLSQDQMTQSAALAALAKVLPLSLMDYLH